MTFGKQVTLAILRTIRQSVAGNFPSKTGTHFCLQKNVRNSLLQSVSFLLLNQLVVDQAAKVGAYRFRIIPACMFDLSLTFDLPH